MICENCGQEMKTAEIIDQVDSELVTYSYMYYCEKCEIIVDVEGDKQ